MNESGRSKNAGIRKMKKYKDQKRSRISETMERKKTGLNIIFLKIIFSVAKATLDLALSVRSFVCPSVTLVQFHQSTLVISRL